MSRWKKENNQQSGETDVDKGLKELEDSVNEMMSALKGNISEVAKELYEELKIEKITIEAVKDFEADAKMSYYINLKNSVQQKRRRFNDNIVQLDSYLEDELGNIANAVVELIGKLKNLKDNSAEKYINDLEEFSSSINRQKKGKLDTKLIEGIKLKFTILRHEPESFLEKKLEASSSTNSFEKAQTGYAERTTNSRSRSTQEKAPTEYDIKITKIQHFYDIILNRYKNQNLSDDDPKMIQLRELEGNFKKLKEDYKPGDSLEKFNAHEAVLKLIIEGILTPGNLKSSSIKELEKGAAEKLQGEKLSKLHDDAYSALNSLSNISKTGHLKIDEDQSRLHIYIGQIRDCINANLASDNKNKPIGRKEAPEDFKKALRELKELERRLWKAERTVSLFKKVAQKSVLRQMQKITKDEKKIFENTMRNRAADISPPVPTRKN